MHRILVDERKWIGERQFLHALNYCMLLPGPEAQQLATYIGWRMHGFRGGLVAGGLFIAPGFVAILGLSLLYTAFANRTWLLGLFVGLKAAVLAVVLQAVLKIGKRVLHNRVMVGIAAAGFMTLYGFAVPFPIVIVAAGAAGLLGVGIRPDLFAVIKGHGDSALVGPPVEVPAPWHAPSWRRSLVVLAVCLVAWLVPVFGLIAALGPSNVYSSQAIFFSKAATVTFGGAYAVLAYVAQQAVETFGWLRPGEMLDGLGMAETTPGPLIQVVQFVGYMGAYRNPGALEPWVAGVLGSVLTTWVTFVPCFLWIFLGAPYVEAVQGNRRLSGGLSAITAAVVGVVANLAVWFGLQVSFAETSSVPFLGGHWTVPVLASIQWLPVAIFVGAAFSLLRFHHPMLRVLAVSATVGAVATMVA